ncbi:MAG: hypothetical protein J2P19_26565, partial [Pseudonocardia sp.]|nr:hypothetical protein [Pseudonocardia sp.]
GGAAAHASPGGGAVVQMPSVGGEVTAPGFGAYCAREDRSRIGTHGSGCHAATPRGLRRWPGARWP